MSEIDKAIERLKSEGYSSEEIKGAMSKMTEDVMKQPLITGSIDKLLDAMLIEDYIDDVIEDLQTSYNLTEKEAQELVKGSAFLVTLNRDPEYVINHDTEYWAERIYTTRVEKKKKFLSAVKELIETDGIEELRVLIENNRKKIE